MNVLTNLGSPGFRRYAYGLCSAVSLALATLGFIDENWVSSLNIVFTALFAVAAANASETATGSTAAGAAGGAVDGWTYEGRHVAPSASSEAGSGVVSASDEGASSGEIAIPEEARDDGRSI